jgi:hypothetical protein
VPEVSPYKAKDAACGLHDHEDLFFGVSFCEYTLNYLRQSFVAVGRRDGV